MGGTLREPYRTNFINNLAKLVKEKNISYYKLCKDINIQNDYISKVNKGTLSITINTLITIADYFNVTTDYLLGR